MTAPPTMNLFMVAGAARPAWTEGGPKQARVAPTRPLLPDAQQTRVAPTRPISPEALALARGGRESASRTEGRRRRGRRPRGRSPSCLPSAGDLRLATQQANAPGDEIDVEERERREVHEERRDDGPGHRPGAGFHQRRRLVQRAPPVNGEVHEGNVERGDDAEHGGEPRAAFTILDHPPEEKVAE